MGVTPLPISADESGVGVLTLSQPERPVVVIDKALVARLEATLAALPSGLKGLVIESGSERSFVAGADLKEIHEASDEQLHDYLRHTAEVFGTLSQLPYPTAAAIRGATLGGGFELAAHCDGLIGAPSPSGKAYPVGLPEAGLCICPGWGGTNLLPARMDPGRAIELTASGTPMMVDDAVEAGVFDEFVEDAGGVTDAAIAWVLDAATPDRDGAPSRWIGRGDSAGVVRHALDAVEGGLPETGAASAVAGCVRAGLDSGWDAGIGKERDELVRLRSTPDAASAIEAFFARSARKTDKPARA